MKKFKLLLLFVLYVFTVNAQTDYKFDVESIIEKGDLDKYINLVILGDGYTAEEQNKFINDAINIANYFLDVPPFSNYKDFFNVYAIKVISAESGVKHPGTATDGGCSGQAVTNPNNYFGTSFDTSKIHRLVWTSNSSKIKNVLNANFPKYDQVLLLANSEHYGGSGGSFFAVSTVHPDSYEIATHEIGHSFSNLADEYWAGDSYASEKPNMTKETDTQKVKWKNWMGDAGVGIYVHGTSGIQKNWYRPHQSCKMRYLGKNFPFCKVCSQALVETIHTLASPIVSYTPEESNFEEYPLALDFAITKLMLPNPNTLKILWTLNGEEIAANVDHYNLQPEQLNQEENTLSVIVVDDTPLLRTDNQNSVSYNKVSWNIKYIGSGIGSSVSENKVLFSIFPNPAVEYVNIKINSEQIFNANISLLSLDGKNVLKTYNNISVGKNSLQSIAVDHLPVGSYLLVLDLDGDIFTEKIIISK